MYETSEAEREYDSMPDEAPVAPAPPAKPIGIQSGVQLTAEQLQAVAERDTLDGILQAALLATTGKSYEPYKDHNLVVAIRVTEAQLAAAKREIAHLVDVAANAYVAKRREGWEKGPTEDEADMAVANACANHGVDVAQRLALLRHEPWPPEAPLFDGIEVVA